MAPEANGLNTCLDRCTTFFSELSEDLEYEGVFARFVAGRLNGQTILAARPFECRLRHRGIRMGQMFPLKNDYSKSNVLIFSLRPG